MSELNPSNSIGIDWNPMEFKWNWFVPMDFIIVRTCPDPGLSLDILDPSLSPLLLYYISDLILPFHLLFILMYLHSDSFYSRPLSLSDTPPSCLSYQSGPCPSPIPLSSTYLTSSLSPMFLLTYNSPFPFLIWLTLSFRHKYLSHVYLLGSQKSNMLLLFVLYSLIQYYQAHPDLTRSCVSDPYPSFLPSANRGITIQPVGVQHISWSQVPLVDILQPCLFPKVILTLVHISFVSTPWINAWQ